MAPPAASASAVLVCQARAGADGRYAVGRFSDPVARRFLDPADLAVVDAVREARVPTTAAGRTAYEMVRRGALSMVPRTVTIDDAIREHAARQIVILGAGLDARAWRMPELAGVTVYEVDHPASQRDKARRAAGLAPTARSVRPVAIDLTSEALGPPLERAGFDARAVTTWVWEGVVPYLPADAVRRTLTQVADSSASGSRVVVNYQARSLPIEAMRSAMRLILGVTRHPDPLAREPWLSLWRPDEMRALLVECGFQLIADDDLLTLSEGLDLPPGNTWSLRNGRVAIAERCRPGG